MHQAHGAVGHGTTQAGSRSPWIAVSHVQHGGSPGMPARFGADVTTKLWWQPSGHGPARTQVSCTSSGVSHMLKHK